MTDASIHRDLIIEGARQNNLKNISLQIPHNALTVITGVSGSGKSSLAFDTIFAEGQWRYIESLSSYTRMFLERVSRPDVDRLLNIRPAIALEQKNPVRTSRSTVGTASEISDYLRLLFAKIGRLICPDCHLQAEAHQPASVAQKLLEEFEHSRVLILFSIDAPKPKQIPDCIASLLKQGYVRLLHHDQVLNLNTDPIPKTFTQPTLHIVIDRLVLREDNRSRLVESLETAFQEGHGFAQVQVVGDKRFSFSTSLRCPQCHQTFDTVRPVHFSFNHVLGACPECKGFGNILHYDENLIIPDPAKSLKDGAIEPWTKPSNHWWQDEMLKGFKKRKLAIATPYEKLSREEKQLLWEGEKKLEGIHQFFKYLEGKRYKMHVRVFLSRYRSPSRCPTCQGSRLRPHALMVRIQGQNIHEVSQWPVEKVRDWLQTLTLTPFDREVASDLVQALEAKLSFLLRVGLNYLTLNREMRTLSGGEAQRISLATQLGSKLVGTLYVLDEPTIGLHPRDTAALAMLLNELAKNGNTVIAVEHDHHVIEQADHVVEMGPASGEKGGEIVCSAPYPLFMKDPYPITARYLRGEESISIPRDRRAGNGKILTIAGAREHNLKNLTVQLPLAMLTCVTGVSGSGKSTLVENLLHAAAARAFKVGTPPVGQFDYISGLEHLQTVRLINQEPIGKTPRSNPVTYMKAFQAIRQVFAQTPEARTHGLTPAHFSFNTGVGRCPRCEGQGHEKLEMYFFEDLYVTCEECEGRRFKSEVLAVQVRGHSIHDVLNMTIEHALAVFSELVPSLARPLKLLDSLGLGYLRLGQPATSLSGGESQRLKIAAELASLPTGKRGPAQSKGILYILDEPTTGLHTEDVKKLLLVLNRLVDAGNTVVVVEHHLDIMKCSDWIIDLGPGGGEHGGEIVAEGRPEDILEIPESHTGRFLRPLFEHISH
ncbi:MAG: UvrABC system protein A [Nitrospirales bacterium]|nr:MAG: UvrABC system protein A [Nitrospirales bacterium]